MVDTVTTSQVAVREPDLVTQIATAPWVWIVIMLIVVLLIVKQFQKGKGRPEEKPWWGMIVKRNMTEKVSKDAFNVWGRKANLVLYKGYGNKIGKAMKIIEIVNKRKDSKWIPLSDDEMKTYYKQKLFKKGVKVKDLTEQELHNKIKEIVLSGEEEKVPEKKIFIDREHFYYFIAFRNFGLTAWIKYYFLGKYEKLMIAQDAIAIDEIKKIAHINPLAYLGDNSGIWTMPNKSDNIIVNEMLWKKENENMAGFQADFLRRLSHEHPLQAMHNERLSHESELKEKAKQGRMTSVLGK